MNLKHAAAVAVVLLVGVAAAVTSAPKPKPPLPAVLVVDPGDAADPLTGPVARSAAGRCGVERWAVQTGADPDAAAVNLTPAPTTLANLARMPSVASTAGGRRPNEMHAAQVTVTVVGARLEPDSDIELVLQDGPSVVRASVPDRMCVVAGSPWKAAINRAHAAVLKVTRTLPRDGRYVVVNRRATVVAVPYIDFGHGHPVGNGVELHPVLSIVFL